MSFVYHKLLIQCLWNFIHKSKQSLNPKAHNGSVNLRLAIPSPLRDQLTCSFPDIWVDEEVDQQTVCHKPTELCEHVELHLFSLISLTLAKVFLADDSPDVLRTLRLLEPPVLTQIEVGLKDIDEEFEQKHIFEVSH